MTALEFEAVVYNQNVYCVICLPPHVALDDSEVIPICPESVWKKAPTCCKCGRTHDYFPNADVSLTAAEGGLEIDC